MEHWPENTTQKMKVSIKDLFSKCGQILRKLWIWSHLLKKFLIENFIFYGVTLKYGLRIKSFSKITDIKLDSAVLSITNDYLFCGETMLRILLERRSKNVQLYRLRDSIVKKEYKMLKRQTICDTLITIINLLIGILSNLV